MSYSERVLYDRYSLKDPDAVLEVGDAVVISQKEVDPYTGKKRSSRKVGLIRGTNNGMTFDVALKHSAENDNEREVINAVPRNLLDYVVELEYQEVCERVSRGGAEKDPRGEEFRKQIFDAMMNMEFVPAGRILSGLGREDNHDLTLFNCYVFNITEDSREGIGRHWLRLLNTYATGGGIGWNLSVLRPRNSIVKKVNGRSSGAVSWGEQFSQVTGAVEQGGSRRGASLQGMWVWHPDIVEFIEAKSLYNVKKDINGKEVEVCDDLMTNSNVSVLISDDFMEAVESNSDWQLIFPDTRHHDYDATWDGDIYQWQRDGKPIEVYGTIKARDLWNKVIEHAWKSGEPGLLFLERANKMSNSYYYDRISCTNPCGEQPLPKNGICNLSHLNLSRFLLENADEFPTEERDAGDALDMVNWDRMREVIRLGVRFLDNCIDLNKYHDADVKAQQMKERRVGLGILGFGEMLMRLGIAYGSKQGVKFTDKLFEFISAESYLASVELAKERGEFTAFNGEKFIESGFMKHHLPNVRSALLESGIRNVTLNTIAPTGSVGALAETTTGIEPYFALEWTSTTRIGTAQEKMSVLGMLKEKFGEDSSEWPDYVVTVQNGISPSGHVKMMATAQRWIDSSISKTVNLPAGATLDDVSSAYISMWRQGCKGGTVYVDQSRDEQVLHSDDAKSEGVDVVSVVDKTSLEGGLRPPLDSGIGPTFSVETPVGSVHSTFRCDPLTGEPYDFFINAGKGEVAANAQGLARMVSMHLRTPNNTYIPQKARLEMIREQLTKIPGASQRGFGPDAIVSLPDAVAYSINKFLEGDYPMSSLPTGQHQLDEMRKELAKHGVPLETLDDWFPLNNTSEAPKVVNPEDFEEEDTKTTYYDYCPRCNEPGWVNTSGKCPRCIKCGYKEC